MRILIDTTTAPRRSAGAGRYARELVRALAALDTADELIILDRWASHVELARESSGRVRVVAPWLPSRLLRASWEQSVLPVLARRLQVDLLHSTHHSLPLVPFGRPTVVTVHDLNFILLPWRYPIGRRIYLQVSTALSVRRASAIIVPSPTVAGDLVRLLHVPKRRIRVVPEAAGAQFRPATAEAVAALRRRLRLPGRYVLSLATLEPGKNRVTLLRAFAALRAHGAAVELVLAGGRGWLQEGLLEQARKLGLNELVHLLGYVPDADLPALYSGAELFVFPSWREGFGLPPLEAMACGTAVVAANAPALPEVLGDGALFATPGDAAALAAAMQRLLSDAGLREELRARGRRQASRYSWERTARETLAVYASVLASPG